MPTYAYRCTACGHAFDAQQSFTDPSLTECPVCGRTLRKVFSPVGVVFKGSGFYRTDSRAGSVPDGSSRTSTQREKEPAPSGDAPVAPPAASAAGATPQKTSGSTTSGSQPGGSATPSRGSGTASRPAADS